AWQLPDEPDARAVAELERSVLAEGGVLRYGQFYGPGTYNEQKLPSEPRVQIDRAAERTGEALSTKTGIVAIIDSSRGSLFGRPWSCAEFGWMRAGPVAANYFSPLLRSTVGGVPFAFT